MLEGKNFECRPRRRKRFNRHYVSCPYYHNATNFVRRIIKKTNIRRVSLAPSIVSNNRRAVYSNLKDKRRLNCVKNSKFKLNCRDCDFSVTLFTHLYDIERTIDVELNDVNSNAYKHCVIYGHCMNDDVKGNGIVNYSNVRDIYIAKNL